MKVIFINNETSEKLARDLPEGMMLEANWEDNMIEAWAYQIVKAEWASKSQIPGLTNLMYLMQMDDDSKARFCWDVENKKKVLHFLMIEDDKSRDYGSILPLKDEDV